MDISTRVEGVTQFQGKLVRFTSEIPNLLVGIGLEAAQITNEEARPTIPRRSGNAARSLRAYVTGTGGIAEGGSSIDYFRWLALGGASGRQHANRRPLSDPDRYIYPGYLRGQDKIKLMMEQSLSNYLDNAGLGG